MSESKIRTRFAPSPTGYMHIGNLRTALFEYLVAKSLDGDFILRIEDTDQGRLVEGSLDAIYRTLELTRLDYSEGPDKGGDYGPYVQSERLNLYRPAAEQLVEMGEAYYCFCSEERLHEVQEKARAEGSDFIGYDRHCRDLPQEEVEAKLAAGDPWVIRQKMPLDGVIGYDDAVFGRIEVENKTLEDHILLKSDGYPTYNFANVVDDHAMKITHIVRGSEYLSSTPKYIHLYNAFGYDLPVFVHVPLINGPDGRKLSKRHGATSFEELLEDGYIVEAIVNYLALLGWSPGTTQELFTLEELEQAFDTKGIAKSPAVFNIEKLRWFNGQYLQRMSPEAFNEHAAPYYAKIEGDPVAKMSDEQKITLAKTLQPRTEQLSVLPEQLVFLHEVQDYDLDLYYHKRMKTDAAGALKVFPSILEVLKETEWTEVALGDALRDYASSNELKNGMVMWPVRIALTGMSVSPGGAIEALYLLGKDESIRRLETAIRRLEEEIEGAEA